jgi:hypothetical protein
LTKAELSQLIIVIYASERRADAPSRAVVEAWHPQLADFAFEDALAVVSQHYADQDRPITLAQLCGGLRKKRAAAKPVDQVEEKTLVPEADPDDPQAYIAAMRGHRYFARRDPADFAERGLDLPAMGVVAEEKGTEGQPGRPRRWWLPRGKGQLADEGE